MKNRIIVSALFFTFLFFQSCVKETPDNANGEAPALPTAETFMMSFDGYQEMDIDTSGFAPTEGGTADVRTTTHFNWFHAGVNVLVWNTVITLNMAIPTAAFFESFNHDPVAQGNGVWLWEYTFTGNANITYTAKLYGEVLDTEEVKWEMFISKQNGFQNVNWYTGITSATQATWTLNHQPNNPEAFLRIEHQKNNGSGEASIRYTNIIPNHVDNGSYIEYRVDNTSTADFDRAYDVYKFSDDNLLEAQWNKATKEGRVKDEKRFGDTEWHCWDESQVDVDC